MVGPFAVGDHVLSITIGRFCRNFSGKGRLRNLFASAALIAINWLIYVWAVSTDHILAASLGYYLNSLVNVLLGRLFLGENHACWVSSPGLQLKPRYWRRWRLPL
jgi:RarD protein